MDFLEELKEAIRLVSSELASNVMSLEEAFCIIRLISEPASNAMSLEEAFREMADLAAIPEIPPQEKRNSVKGLPSAKPVRCSRNHHKRWHTAATGE